MLSHPPPQGRNPAGPAVVSNINFRVHTENFPCCHIPHLLGLQWSLTLILEYTQRTSRAVTSPTLLGLQWSLTLILEYTQRTSRAVTSPTLLGLQWSLTLILEYTQRTSRAVTPPTLLGLQWSLTLILEYTQRTSRAVTAIHCLFEGGGCAASYVQRFR